MRPAISTSGSTTAIWPSIFLHTFGFRHRLRLRRPLEEKMSVKDFLKRRLIRLHPMVVMGAVIGAVMFYFQGCSVWDVSAVSYPCC
ncbi:MAG: hypothetical protein ACLRM8_08270 [Alistipes sp.]